MKHAEKAAPNWKFKADLVKAASIGSLNESFIQSMVLAAQGNWSSYDVYSPVSADLGETRQCRRAIDNVSSLRALESPGEQFI